MAIDKLPIFQGNNVVSAADHWRAFKGLIRRASNNYEDVKMRLFALPLEDDASDWFISLPINTISTSIELKNVFMENGGEEG
jgi:hypothetical protein